MTNLVPVTLAQARLARAAREPYKGLDPDFEAPVIPWKAYEHFLEQTACCWTMSGRKAHYWQTVRVMVGMLQWTGCRIKELERMRPDLVFGNVIYWPIGKNQKGMRKEYLPDSYLQELALYRKLNSVPEGKIFNVCEETFTRYFNRDVRPHLGEWWNRKAIIVRNNLLVLDNVLQLKGFRKNFQTILFKKLWDKYADAGVALEFTSKRMRHDSAHCTAYHYIQNFESLDVSSWLKYWSAARVQAAQQLRLLDYCDCASSR